MKEFLIMAIETVTSQQSDRNKRPALTHTHIHMKSVNYAAVKKGREIEQNFLFCLCVSQIKHMMAFIEQEANEKAEEIDAKVKTHAWRSPLTNSIFGSSLKQLLITEAIFR